MGQVQLTAPKALQMKKVLINSSSVTASRWSDAEIEHWHRLYALRSQLGGLAARQAAVSVSKGASAAALGACYRRMHQLAARGDYGAFLEADMDFHREVARLSGTAVMPQMWLLLEEQSRSFVAWAHQVLFNDLEIIASSHEPQWAAISRGEARQAERATHIDLDALWQMIAEQPAEASTDPDPVERVCAYAIINLNRPLVFGRVARDVVHLSPSHLARLFRERRGEPFSVYVQNLRMRRAASLLVETDLAVQDIADRTGYKDPSRFTVHFKRAYGCTPQEHRRRFPAGHERSGIVETLNSL